jgi:hypothetical protein
MSSRLALVIATAAAVGACSESGSDPDVRACTPLATEPPATTNLGFALGIGRHADGTLYAMDQTHTGEYRVFSSSGTTLARRPIAGFGQGALGDGRWYVVTVSDVEPQFTLKIDGTATPTRMGVVRGAFADHDFVIGQAGDVLEMQTADALAGMTINDIPRDVYVEYFAHLADGRQLVVTRPRYNWTTADFRLFLGTTDRMNEHEVTTVSRHDDATTVAFVVNGAAANATFPTVAPAPTLSTGGATLALTLEPTGTAPPSSASFFCLH